MCSSYRDLSAHSGGFAGLVLPLSKCPVNGIPRLIGSSREKEYPSLIARAYNGLSWDTPAGFELSKAVPAVVTPPIQSYTNHARKCVRSRSGTHGKISQHNSTNKISHTSIIIQARGLEGSNTSARS